MKTLECRIDCINFIQQRIETKNGNTLANVYFDYLKNQTQCLSVVCTKVFNVADQKPASIVVYDYYSNGKFLWFSSKKE